MSDTNLTTLDVTTLKIGSTAVTSTAAELNILDGVTATAAELNILDGVTSTAAELNILDGVTSTAAELNILDTVTATAAELNILDGVTATAAELNALDGITATVAELNITDGVTATAIELNEAIISLDIADLSVDTTYYMVMPHAGTITKIWTVIDGAVGTADGVLTANIGGTPITNGVVTIATAGSAAGDVDSATPTAANVVTAGAAINLVATGAGSGGSPRCHVYVVLTR